MGRKNLPLDATKKHYTVEEQEAKIQAEKKAKEGYASLPTTAPKGLDSVAVNEYKRIIKASSNLPLTNLDRTSLELYCFWYSAYKADSKRYVEANKVISTLSNSTDEEEQKKVKEAENSLRFLSTRLDRATKSVRSFASDLGLTVDSRMRMNMPSEEDSGSILDKF